MGMFSYFDEMGSSNNNFRAISSPYTTPSCSLTFSESNAVEVSSSLPVGLSFDLARLNAPFLSRLTLVATLVCTLENLARRRWKILVDSLYLECD